MAFQPGDLVFAKMKGYRHWPARINPLPAEVFIPKGKYPIFFYGTHQICFMNKNELFPFEMNLERFGKPGQPWFNNSMKEARESPHIYELGQDPLAEAYLLKFYVFTPTDPGCVPLGDEVLNIEEETKPTKPTQRKPRRASSDRPTSSATPAKKRKLGNQSVTSSRPTGESLHDDDEDDKSVSSISSDDDKMNDNNTGREVSKNMDEQLKQQHLKELKKEEKAMRVIEADHKRAKQLHERVDKKEEKKNTHHRHSRHRSSHQRVNYRESDEEDTAEPSYAAAGPANVNENNDENGSHSRDDNDEDDDDDDSIVIKKRKPIKIKMKLSKSHRRLASSKSNDEVTAYAPKAEEDLTPKSKSSGGGVAGASEVNNASLSSPMEMVSVKKITVELIKDDDSKPHSPQQKGSPKKNEPSSQSIERNLVRYNQLIKGCLVRGSENYSRCLKAMDRLSDLSGTVQFLHLARCWDLMETLKKCRKYKACENIRDRALLLYKEFQDKASLANEQDLQLANTLITKFYNQRNLLPTSTGSIKQELSPEVQDKAPDDAQTVTNVNNNEVLPRELKTIDTTAGMVQENAPPPPTDLTSLAESTEQVEPTPIVEPNSPSKGNMEEVDSMLSLVNGVPGFELLKGDLGLKTDVQQSHSSPSSEVASSMRRHLPAQLPRADPVKIEWSDETIKASMEAVRHRSRMNMRQRSGRRRVQRRRKSSSDSSSDSHSSSSSSSSESSEHHSHASENHHKEKKTESTSQGEAKTSTKQSANANDIPTTTNRDQSHNHGALDLDSRIQQLMRRSGVTLPNSSSTADSPHVRRS